MICPCGFKWVVLWSLWAAMLIEQPTQLLRVSGGALRGIISRDGSHARYLGIPYATVTKRFQAAQPNPQWPGVFDAFNGHIRCTQRLLGMVVGEEDCLVLNVYTPLPKKDNLLPVMVFIHGGGFRDGSGAPVLYGPNYLIKKDVILVTLNYRVEILGFLCLGIEEAPGNAGLKDQQEALKWIKKNIRAFGGDLDKITIFGESAGSASVMYHLLSSLSEGLFNRAIMQSGSATAPWAFQFEPLKAASLLAKELGYETKNPKEIYNLFMKTTARDLMTMRVPRKKGDIVLSENVFVPCIDKELPGVNRFINDTPYNLLARGDYTKVPVIIGFNNEEGLMFFGKENDTTISEMDFYKALPRNLVFPTEKEAKATAAKLNETYIGNKEDDITIKLSRFEGDSGITYPVISATQLLLNTNDNPIYIYKFPYSGLLNVAKFFSGFTHVSGASHADDLFYLFKTAIFLPTSLLETKMINKMTSMWTNFAKTGNPTPELTTDLPMHWHPANKVDPQVFVIDEKLTTAPLWEDEAILHWNATYAKYRRLE